MVGGGGLWLLLVVLRGCSSLFVAVWGRSYVFALFMGFRGCSRMFRAVTGSALLFVPVLVNSHVFGAVHTYPQLSVQADAFLVCGC